MLKVQHVPEQLIDVTITPVLFVLMFTYLFGGALAGSTGAYLQYVLPGILVMSVVFTTVYSGVALNTDLTKGVVDRFRSLPIWRPAPLLGALLGDSVRYVVAGTVIIVVGVALGYRPDGAFFMGDPDTVAAKLLRVSEQLGGVDRISLQMTNPRLAHADLLRGIELLGREVMPRVAAAQG